MKKDKVRSKKREYDTFSITMELEKPLLYDEKLEIAEQKQKKLRKERIKKRILSVLAILLVGIVVGFFIWISNYYCLDSESEKALISDTSVEVKIEKDCIYYTPKNITPKKGFILYPAAKVDARSYVKLCKLIAQNGYEVVTVDMPLNISLLGKNEANHIIDKYKNIDTWVIGGDSLGGVMAAKYAAENIDKIDGVVLISSYPVDSDLKDINMDVLSIWGSKDSVVDFQSLIDAKSKLPDKTSYVEIEGANHSQFGNYGMYKGDSKALISSKDQQEKASENIVNFMENIK